MGRVIYNGWEFGLAEINLMADRLVVCLDQAGRLETHKSNVMDAKIDPKHEVGSGPRL